MSVKQFLETNRIFFEVIGWAIVSLAGIVLSYYSVLSSQRQSELLRLDHLPALQISRISADKDKDGLLETDVIEIENDGYFLSEFYVQTATLLQLSRSHALGPSDTILVPVHNYFDIPFYTARRRGSLASITGYENKGEFAKLETALHKRYHGYKGRISFEPSLLVILAIKYRDFEDITHQEYYQIDQMGSVRRLTNSEGASLLEQWNQGFKAGGTVIVADTSAVETIFAIGTRKN